MILFVKLKSYEQIRTQNLEDLQFIKLQLLKNTTSIKVFIIRSYWGRVAQLLIRPIHVVMPVKMRNIEICPTIDLKTGSFNVHSTEERNGEYANTYNDINYQEESASPIDKVYQL